MADDMMNFAFSELSLIPPDPPAVRSTCDKCRRPSNVCWCCYLPREPLIVQTKIFILQHPFEESRNLQTAVMLTHGLQNGSCKVFKGKKFSLKRFTELEEIVELPNTLLLYPSTNSVDINIYSEKAIADGASTLRGPFNLIVLDGTWHQARGIFCQNSFLHSIKQVKISNAGLSKYVIRTQPTDSGLSTVEVVAMAISLLENRPDVYEKEHWPNFPWIDSCLMVTKRDSSKMEVLLMSLIKPLDALCEHQLRHGAVKHHSKQYLLENGLYKKQNRRTSETNSLPKDILSTDDSLTIDLADCELKNGGCIVANPS